MSHDCQKFPLAQKHTVKTTVFLYLFPGVKNLIMSSGVEIVYNNHAQIQKLVLVKINQIFVMITVVIIKKALCFYKSEPLVFDDDSN